MTNQQLRKNNENIKHNLLLVLPWRGAARRVFNAGEHEDWRTEEQVKIATTLHESNGLLITADNYWQEVASGGGGRALASTPANSCYDHTPTITHIKKYS